MNGDAEPGGAFRDVPVHTGKSPATLFSYDEENQLRWVKNAPPGIAEESFMSLLERCSITGVSNRTFPQALARVRKTGEIFYGECGVIIHDDQRRFELTLMPHINDRVLGIANDLGEREPSELAVRDLSLELAHRTKNLMAVISSLAIQTARRISSVDEFTRLFVGQIRALSGAHDAIAATGWRGASLSALVAATFLTPNATQNVAMVLHELVSHCDQQADVTLSFEETSGGVLQISWTASRSRNPRLVWEELLTKVAPLALNGESTLDHDGNTLDYRLAISGEHFTRT